MIDLEPAQSPPARQARFATSHFVVWLSAGAIFYFADQLDRIFNLWLLILPVVAIPAFIAICTFVVGLVANLWKRRWHRLVFVIAAPILTIGLLATLRYYRVDPDWLRFQLTSVYYMRLTRDLPGPSPKFGRWGWGSTGGAIGPTIFYSLVFDESDKPLDRLGTPGQKSPTWSARAYGHHFFLVTELYQ
jgi:hypothetical protein